MRGPWGSRSYDSALSPPRPEFHPPRGTEILKPTQCDQNKISVTLKSWFFEKIKLVKL